MTDEEREKWLDLNEQLCKEYVETDDPLILEKIAVTEQVLFASRACPKNGEEL